MDKRQRFVEIETELRKLRQRQRELLEERRSLSGATKRSVVQHWVDPAYEIIMNRPGISRRDLFVALDDKNLRFQDLTNILTILRRRGWIENHGTKKYPRWHAKERPEPSPLPPIFSWEN